MPVREFTDSNGVHWRAWDVTADQLEPVTRVEDLFDLASGWLTFECDEEKRRLAPPYPANWSELTEVELQELCERARRVMRRSAAELAVRKPMMRPHLDPSVARHFTSPRGREWTVRLHECVDRAGGQRTVLRFTADDLVVDVDQWPDNWSAVTPDQYALMLLDAHPPRRPGASGPQRRKSDRPS